MCAGSSHRLHIAFPEPESVPHTSLVLGCLSHDYDSKASTNSFFFFFNEKVPSKSVTAPSRFSHATEERKEPL